MPETSYGELLKDGQQEPFSCGCRKCFASSVFVSPVTLEKVQTEFDPMSVDVKFHGIKSNLDKERDPMAGIMDLMKNMYEEGDDEMKKTIAKAWTDARSGKPTDPMRTTDNRHLEADG
ncbi:hypothetical protein R6Q57_027951 [Mikania cordata]